MGNDILILRQRLQIHLLDELKRKHGEYHICLFDDVAGGLPMRSKNQLFFFPFCVNYLLFIVGITPGGLPMRSSFEFFFFVFYANTYIVIVAITPGVVPILDFRDFWI